MVSAPGADASTPRCVLQPLLILTLCPSCVVVVTDVDTALVMILLLPGSEQQTSTTQLLHLHVPCMCRRSFRDHHVVCAGVCVCVLDYTTAHAVCVCVCVWHTTTIWCVVRINCEACMCTRVCCVPVRYVCAQFTVTSKAGRRVFGLCVQLCRSR